VLNFLFHGSRDARSVEAQSPIDDRQSAIGNRQSAIAIANRQSTIDDQYALWWV
jgi:hypothetical protein